jgi:RNA polymerase sigma factor (sigma-70 family)
MTPPPAEQFAARIFMGPALRAQPDRRLVDLVRDGYDAAFEEIVRRYRRPLDRFAAAIVGGRSEDVTQDAFSKALLALRGSEAEIELRPWLYRIVRNTALNDLRDREPATDEIPEGLPGSRSVAAEVEAREELADLMQRLHALPENYRAAIVMRELEGLSHEEIAAALGLSGGAARQVLYRARTTLREGLGLVVPLPVMRALAEHFDDAGRAGGAIAAGAGGAALSGLGGGALKAGMATVLIAGAVGTGIAVDHHKSDGAGPEAAEAAPLTHGKHSGNGANASASGTKTAPSDSVGKHGHGGKDRGPSDHSGRGKGGSGSVGDGSGSGRSGDGSKNSGGGSSDPSNQGPSSGSGGGGDKSGGSGKDVGGSSGGSGSDGSGDSGGSSGGSSGEESTSGSNDGSGDSGGGGDGGEVTEPTTPELLESSDGGGDSGSTESSGETSGGSGSGDLSGSDSSGSDVSP